MSYDSTGPVTLGTRTATSVGIGRSGVTTTFTSGSTVDFDGAIVEGISFAGTTFTGLVEFKAGIQVDTGFAATFEGTANITTVDGSIVTSGAGNIATTGTGNISSAGLMSSVGQITATGGLTSPTDIVTTLNGNITTTGTGSITTTAGGSISSANTVTAGTGLIVAGGVIKVPASGITYATPTYTFTGQTNTGMVWDDTDVSLELVQFGAKRLIVYHQNVASLVNNTARPIVRLTGLSDAGDTSRAGYVINWYLEASDGTTNQALSGTTWVAASQTLGDVSGNTSTSYASVSGGVGTLDATMALDVSVPTWATLNLTPMSSLSSLTTLRVEMSITSMMPTATVAIVLL